MSLRPEKLSQTPSPLDVQDPREDVLADILGASLLHNAIYKRIECGAPWGMSVGAHDRATFYLVARGSARFELAEAEPIVLSAGDALFVPHGSAHVVRDSAGTKPTPVCDGPSHPGRENVVRRIGGSGARTSLVAGFFPFSARKPVLLESMPRVVPLLGADPTQNRWIAATLQLITAESSVPGPASALVLQRLADVLFVQTLRSLAVAPACKQGGLAALSDPAIHDALGMIHRDVARPWTVASLAKAAGLSRSAFAARFSSLVGEPPLQYLARWRMARAAERLRETRARINEIAAAVGYESVPSFNKAFRKWQGDNPTAFRKRHAPGIARAILTPSPTDSARRAR